MLAADEGKTECVRLLIDAHANLEAKNTVSSGATRTR
jgi:ankyrin repeat protein